MSEYEDFETINEINKIIQSEDIQALPSIYEKKEKTNVVTEGTALVASANKKTLPNRRVGRFEMLEVLERSLSRTVLNFNNPSQRAFTAMRELSDFVNMATTGATPKIADAHRDLLPVGHPLSTKKHNFSQEELAYARAEWMSADPRIAEEFRPMVATAFVTPADSVEREYLIAKLEATDATLVPRDVILGLTAGGDPYGGGNSFLARSTRARAQRRDRKGRFAWMGGGAKVWLGELFNAVSSLFRFAGYNSKTDSFDLEGIPGSPYFGKIVSVPASKVEAVKAILPEIPGLALPKSKSVSKNLIVDPASLVVKDAPTGWTKVSSENGVDTFRSADGWVATRYPNLASAPNEPSITRVRGVNDDKSINPDLPVYHIAKGSSDGLITDKPFAVTQGWGDAQALIARYDKKTTSSGKRKKASKSAQQKFIKGWTKGEGGYIPGKWNAYTGTSDRAGGKDFYTDPSGRYVAVKLATPPATWQTGAEDYKQREDERTRSQVLNSGLPIHTFDGAKDWDGNVDNLYRLERVKSDGRRELLGFYQDLEDIERDTEIPLTEDKSQDFYESVIADTIQNGGNTIDFVDGSWPEDGYIVAHEADIPQKGGTLAKREELVTPEDFADPIEGPKKLRAFVLKNQDKLSQQGFYLGTWLDTVDVTDENGKVVDQREMVFLDVSEYEPNFDKAFDKAEARSELAYYGVSEGRSFYVKDEKHRREVVRKTPVFDEAEEKRVRAEADKIIKEEDKWFSDNRPELLKTVKVPYWLGGGDDAIPNPELQKDYPEIYRRLTRRFEAEKSRGSVFREYIRSVFQMSDGMDPGGRNDGLSGHLLATRDNYVGHDRKTLEMNKALRDGGDVTSKVQKIDALVNKSKLKDDTQFFRGAWLDPELVKDMEVGDMFFDRAFQSMGLEEDTASSYLDFREEASPGKSRVIFRLLLPKGMNAIHVGDDEVIGRRNTKMRIIRKSKLDGTTYFDVDVEPQTKEEINARIQGRVPKPEESQDGASSSELPANDGGGADGLGDGGTLPINYGPKPTGERPEQATRIADPEEAIWDRSLIDIGIRDEVIDETIRTQGNLENVTRQALKDHVSLEIRKKLKGVKDKEFVELMTHGLANNLTVEDFGFEGTRNIDFIGVVDIDGNSNRTRGLYTSIGRLISSSGGVPRNFPKDLADRLKTGKITRKDAEEVVRLLNEFRATPPFVDNGKLHIPSVDDKDFMEYLRYRTVSNLISMWAVSSNGTNPLSLAIQSVAEKEFGVKGTAEWDMPIGVANEVKDIAKKNENILRKFLRAQYDLTQEYFQKKGISKITLYRGIKEFIRHDIKDATFPSENGFVASVKLRPLSAWSTSMAIANRFRNIQSGKMFRKEFDVKDIFSLPSTGVGCFPEKEIVVLGGLTKDIDISGEYKVDQPRAVFPSPKPQPITYKEEQPQIQVNNAPIDLSRIPPDDGGEEPELDIFDLEGVNPFYADPAFHKQQVARNIADSDEMVEVSDSEMVELSDWFNLFSTDELEWGDDGKRAVGSIRLLALDNGEWAGDYEFSDLLSSVEENIKFGGVEPFKKGSVLERVVNGYINQEDPSISKEELAKFFEEYNEHFDVDYSDSYLVPDIENQQFMNLLREEIASNLIHVWAETSNGDHPMSHAIQDIASDILDIKEPAEWDEGKTQDEKDTLFNSILDIRENYGEALEAFVKAQYRITQEWFEERGIKELVVYRGVTNPIGADEKSKTLKLRPLSSWSQRLDTSLKFTGGTINPNGTVFRSIVDVKDIFSTPFTGFGCLEEEEIVLLGGKKQVDAKPVKDVWGGFWKDEPQVAINNAPIDNAPKPMSNTERKRLEREKRKAEEAVAPSPEEAKQQMEQGRQNLSEVAQTIPENIDTFFDPNNPLNILNARNITNEITGTDGNKDNLTQDEILQEKVLFMEPTKEWYDLLDKVEQSGTPFAREIISRVKKDHARLVEKVRKGSLDERQAQINYDNSVRDIQNIVNNLVTNALANPRSVPDLNLSVSLLMRELDAYFSGNPRNISLSDNTTLLEMTLLSLYDTTDSDVASRNPDFNQGRLDKLALDLVARFRGAYTMYGSSSKTPNRNALTKEIQKIYIENFFGGVNPTDIENTLRRMVRLYNSNSVPSLIPNDAAAILRDRKNKLVANDDWLILKKIELEKDKEDLAKKISNVTKQVLSENGLEFDHGVELSANDLNWDGVNNFTQKLTVDPVTGQRRIALQPIPDDIKADMPSELKTRNGVLNVINAALQALPRPVALAVRDFLIDNKSSFSFTSGTRGATALLNLNSPAKAHDIGDITLDSVIKGMSLGGSNKERAIGTTVHEMVHLIVNGIFRNQMNAIAWAKQSRETNNVAPDGKIFHNFVDGNRGNIAYTPNGDYLSLEDLTQMIQFNELGAASPNYANPYIGKYGTSGGANVALGQSPFSHGELLSTLLESLLGGGVSGMFSTYASPRRVLSGTNPDGTPKYITMDDSVFSERMIPFGVSMIVLLNELAKLKLGIK